MTALLALLMALNAFAIDAMIPALPQIGIDLGVAEENRRQLIVIAYFVGFGSTQLIWGPLADRFGRKPVLALGIALYGLFALLCGIASTFAMLIAARAAMGASAAVARVLVISMVRDLFEGEKMARVMSLVFMTFMLVPVLAPNVGQAILLVASWRAIFLVLAAYAGIMIVWSLLRMPETLHEDYRRTLKPSDLADALWRTISDRLSLGYTLATTIIFASLVAYIASIQQIVFDVFDAGQFVGLVFAAIAAPMALAAWTNSRIVERFGLRKVSQAGLLGILGLSLVHLAIAAGGYESLATFIIFQALTFCCFAFTSSNFGTLAMTNMAPIAGSASSVQGTISTLGSAAIGFAIGQAFDGTVLPYLAGLALCAAGAFVIVAVTENGRLFRRRPNPVPIASDPGPGIPEDYC